MQCWAQSWWGLSDGELPAQAADSRQTGCPSQCPSGLSSCLTADTRDPLHSAHPDQIPANSQSLLVVVVRTNLKMREIKSSFMNMPFGCMLIRKISLKNHKQDIFKLFMTNLLIFSVNRVCQLIWSGLPIDSVDTKESQNTLLNWAADFSTPQVVQ